MEKKGARVGILDADLYGPSVRHMLPEEELPKQALEDPSKILPAMAKGIPYISMAFFRKDQEASVIRAPIANSAILQFLNSVQWGDLDYLLIDFPPGTGDIQLTLAQQANLSGAILVTLPQELSIIDVRKAAQLFEQTRIPILGIIENMHALFPGDAATRYSKEIGCPVLSQIGFDPLICQAADQGRDPSTENDAVAKIFMELAQTLETALSAYSSDEEVQFALKDSEHLRVEWKDGVVKEIPLAELQASCPCIRCKEKSRKVEQVLADRIEKMGRYAMSVHYQSGCSKGIYPFAMLRAWRTVSL